MHKVEPPKQPVIDRVISYLAPTYAARRTAAREALALMPRGGARGSARGAIKTRLDDNWTYGTNGTVSRLSTSNQRSMRARAQQLDRDNSLFSTLLSRSVDFCVGKGFVVQALTDDEGWNNQAEALWRDYWQSPEASGLSGLEVDRAMWRAWKRDGAAEAVLLKDGRIQLIEDAQLVTPRENLTKAEYFDGVEVDKSYRPVAFHVATDNGTQRVPARDMLYLPNLKRVVDVRGTPALASSFGLFDQIDGYIEAAIVAARMAACFGIIRKMESPSSGPAGLPLVKNSDNQAQPQITVEPGLFEYAATADELSQIDPKQPGAQFEPLVRTLMRIAALEMGFPAEVAFLDFSTSNYSRAKASLNQAQRSAEPQQQVFINRFRTPLYRWRISKWMKEGKLPRRDDAWKHKIIADPWPYIDPRHDISGLMMEVDAGLKTEADQILARGGDPADVRKRRAHELDEKRKLGIPVMRSNLTAQLEDEADFDPPTGDDDAD